MGKEKSRYDSIATFGNLRTLPLDELHKLKKDLAERLARKRNSVLLVMYYPHEPVTAIRHQDPPEVLDILREIGKVQNLDLLINSQGGDLEAAYQIAICCREYCNKFGVIIPRDALSAATLIALGADEVLMGPLGVLGPLDPMIKHPSLGWIPGMAIRRSVDVLDGELKESRSTISNKGKYIIAPIADKIDPILFSAVSDIIKSAVPYALDLLLKTGKREDEAKKMINILIEGYPTHCIRINRESAKKIGFNVVDVDPEIHDCAFDILKCYQIICEKEIEVGRRPKLIVEYFKPEPRPQTTKSCSKSESKKKKI